MEYFRLDGKTALITGAAGRLGLQHCLALADVGCDVILTDVDQLKLVTQKNLLEEKYPSRKFYSFVLDVRCEASVRNVQTELENQHLNLDILINNAAVNPQVTTSGIVNTSRLENFRLDDWKMQIDVGLTGAFLCSKYFGFMISKNLHGGVIVNIASDLSVIAPDQRLYESEDLPNEKQNVKPISYSVVKTGLIGLTRYLSTYWSNAGVRCNALSPGGVEAEQPKEFIERVSKLIPAGRMAAKHEYHAALQFLCCDASKYMTGQNLVIDGGRSVW